MKNFIWQKNNFVSKKNFQNFLKIFFAKNVFSGWCIAKKKFSKNFGKKFWPKNFWNFFPNENFYYFLSIFRQGKAWLQNLHLLWIGYGQNFQWNMVISPWIKQILYSCLWLFKHPVFETFGTLCNKLARPNLLSNWKSQKSIRYWMHRMMV